MHPPFFRVSLDNNPIQVNEARDFTFRSGGPESGNGELAPQFLLPTIRPIRKSCENTSQYGISILAAMRGYDGITSPVASSGKSGVDPHYKRIAGDLKVI